jgi:predicted DNA-binding transcriptional regulator AlpA
MNTFDVSPPTSAKALLQVCEPTRSGPRDEELINASDMRKMLGDVSDMTLWRWLRRKELGFPQPAIICGRRYWRRSDIIRWRDERFATS